MDFKTRNPIKWMEEVGNLAEKLSDDESELLGSMVVDGWDEDENSRIDYIKRYDEWLKLAMQSVDYKQSSIGHADVKYPLLTQAALSFGARTYSQLIPGTKIVRGTVTGYDSDGSKQESAERVGRHMSYQLLEEMEDWEEGMDKLTVTLPIVGCMFKKTYRDAVKRVNKSELLYSKELVINYWARNIEEARKTHILQLSDNAVWERAKSGLWLDEKFEKVIVESTPTEDKIRGATPPPVGDTTPHIFGEQHWFVDLDNDGYAEPYIITVHKETRKVVRVVANYDRETAHVNQKEIVSLDPIQYFTKFGFIPSPDGGFYDVGFGSLLSPLNETINTTINQILDAGTKNTMGGGLLGRGLRLRAGEYRFKLGEYKVCGATGEDLNKNVWSIPQVPVDPTTFSLLSLMIDASRQLASTVDILVGETPGQNTPATTSMAVRDEALKVFSSIFKRIHRSTKQELKKLRRLNRLYMPESQYYRILDLGKESGDKVFKADYNIDVTDVQLYSDPNMVSTGQKLMKSQSLKELLALGTVNIQETTKRVLEAEEHPNIDALLQPNPPPPPDARAEADKLKQENEQKKLQILEQTGMGDLQIKIQKLELQKEKDAARYQKELAELQIKVLNAQRSQMVEDKDAQTRRITAESEAAKDMAQMKKLMAETMAIIKEMRDGKDNRGPVS